MKCGACPVLGDTPCQGGTFCSWATQRNDVLTAHIVAVASGKRTPCDEARPSAAGMLAKLAAMKACPHFEKRSDCGCGVNACRLGKGDKGLVGHQQCFDCLDSESQ